MVIRNEETVDVESVVFNQILAIRLNHVTNQRRHFFGERSHYLLYGGLLRHLNLRRVRLSKR